MKLSKEDLVDEKRKVEKLNTEVAKLKKDVEAAGGQGGQSGLEQGALLATLRWNNLYVHAKPQT